MPARRVELEGCRSCGYCSQVVDCPAGDPLWHREECYGCGACVPACPYGARRLVEVEREPIEVSVDGESVEVEARWVEGALRELGVEVESPCGVGGCYACAVKVNGELRPACNTGLEEGDEVRTEGVRRDVRVMSGFQPHEVGGVGTPVELKDRPGPVEAACFAHGCNLRCPQCQNHVIAFGAASGARMTAAEAARLVVGTAREHGIDRVAISGGEPTLNPDFLVEFVRRCRELEPGVRVHVDTNGTVLTPGYVDRLVEAGMTDLGIDVKGFRPETFARIAGVDRERAAEYLDNVLRVLEYLADEYLGEELFVGVGIPYNPALVDKEEVFALTDWLYAHVGEELQVCYLDYRPEFRRRDLPLPRYEDMVELEEYARSLGFKRVHAQKVSVRR
ncbi:radical SAM protein [Methanopyrus sp.]